MYKDPAYIVVKSSKGYAIFFEDQYEKEYVSDALSLKQANKWCKRLNKALDRGYASHY